MTFEPDALLGDSIDPRPVLSRELIHRGMVWNVVQERVDLGDAGQVTREFVEHPGATGCVALDDQLRILLIQQYRHPTGALDWEVPGGLLDVAGEPPLVAAARELAEEADLRADTWHLLGDWQNSPGGSSENWRCFLARDVSPVPHGARFEREHEEADIVIRWVPLADAVDAVLAGRIHNATTVASVLAVELARQRDWSTLRPADSPWPEHPAYR